MAKVKRSTDTKKLVSNKKKTKKVSVAKEIKIATNQQVVLERKPESSNAGDYKNVSPSNFTGSVGGASPYTFHIDTLARAKSALARAHFATHPEGIQRAVYTCYPQLDPTKNKK